MRIRTSKDMGALVRDARTKAGMTQADLARHIGVARLWVSQLESGKPGASMGHVLRALNVLGVDLMTGPDVTPDSVRDGHASATAIHRILQESRRPYDG